MKKTLIYLLAIICAASLVSCGNKRRAADPAVREAVEETVASVEESAASEVTDDVAVLPEVEADDAAAAAVGK